MKQAGCNMTNTESYVRASIALLIGFVALEFQLWYLLIVSAILFYTAYEKYCLMFKLFGINKKLRIENYYHALLPQYSPYANCIFNEQNNLVFVNKSALDLFKHIRQASDLGIMDVEKEILANTQRELIFKDGLKSYQLHIQGIAKEHILLVYINNITDILALKSSNTDLAGKVEDVLSENALKNHLLAQQSKFATTGELIENITHQWKQPLSTLSSVLLNLQYNDTLTRDKMNEEMTKASSLIQIMSHTVDDFKNFFKADKQQSAFSIGAAMKNVMLILDSSLEKEGIEVINHINHTIMIQGYKNEFTQVLLNIVNNAKDALLAADPKEKKITLETFYKDNRVSLCINDTAGGIPDKYINQVFDSHFTTKGDKEGTGIGLHMSKIIIEKDMKGTISVSNNDQGAEFTIKLPASIAI